MEAGFSKSKEKSVAWKPSQLRENAYFVPCVLSRHETMKSSPMQPLNDSLLCAFFMLFFVFVCLID